jgi:predicted Zn-dependent protease
MGDADLLQLPRGDQISANDIVVRAHRIGQRIEPDNNKLVVIALTTRDINDSAQSLRFLFSQNQAESRTAVVSIARMTHATSRAEGSQAQIATRIYKMVKRQIGELHFGLKRSSDLSDVMYAPIMSLEDVDAMGSNFRK